MERVCIIQRRLTNYRVEFFNSLKNILAENDVNLEVLVGEGTPLEIMKEDRGVLSWATQVPTYYLAGGKLCWQSIPSKIRNVDLVIITQENRLLRNYMLLFWSRRFKLAFWGHGANFQSDNPNGLREIFKRWVSKRVDWWFAYTEMSAAKLKELDYPQNRITVLNNAVNTNKLRHYCKSFTDGDTTTLRKSLEIAKGQVGIYVGSLYTDKRLDFLFAAAEEIRREVVDFHLIIVGDGPERDIVQNWCARHSWAHWVGARFGKEKAAYISLAQVMLNPGLIGLGILDSFACEVPIVTTDCKMHSPEIAYLEHGVNGIMTADNVAAYSKAVINLLRSEKARDLLAAGCVASAELYTIENMAKEFSNGVLRCLRVGRYQR